MYLLVLPTRDSDFESTELEDLLRKMWPSIEAEFLREAAACGLVNCPFVQINYQFVQDGVMVMWETLEADCLSLPPDISELDTNLMNNQMLALAKDMLETLDLDYRFNYTVSGIYENTFSVITAFSLPGGDLSIKIAELMQA